MYQSCIGSYAYLNCKIATTIQVKLKDHEVQYHPLLVSVKNWSNVSKRDVITWLATRIKFLESLRAELDDAEENEKSAVCWIVLLGCATPPDDIVTDGLGNASLSPFPATDVYRLICVDDTFGISKARICSSWATKKRRVHSSHAFMAGESAGGNLLRKKSSPDNTQYVNHLFTARNPTSSACKDSNVANDESTAVESSYFF